MTRRPRSVLALTVALLLGVAACSVSTNGEPLAIGTGFDDLLTTTTSTTTTTAPAEVTRSVRMYFLQTVDGSVGLVPVVRELPLDAGIAETLAVLFTQRPDPDVEAGVETAIPESAELISAGLAPASTVLVVDVRGLFGSLQGNNLRNALAQIVWTATNTAGIDQVLFRNDGVAVPAIAGDGTTISDPVDRSNYTLLN